MQPSDVRRDRSDRDAPAAAAALLDSAVLARVSQEQSAAQDQSARPVFLTKAERQALALARLEQRRAATGTTAADAAVTAGAAAPAPAPSPAVPAAAAGPALSSSAASSSSSSSLSSSSSASAVSAAEAAEAARLTALVRSSFYGSSSAAAAALPPQDAPAAGSSKGGSRGNGGRVERPPPGRASRPAGGSLRDRLAFEWDASADTTLGELDPLYLSRPSVARGFGRSGLAGVGSDAKTAEEYRRKVAAVQAGGGIGDHSSGSHGDEAAVLAGAAASSSSGIIAALRSDSVSAAAVTASKDARARERAEKSYQKSRHWSQKSLAEMEDRDWRIFREDYDITTRGSRVPAPLRAWNEAPLPPALLQAIANAGFREPSKIQRAAIPVGLANRDVVGIAETGSGKTLAFLLPMFVYILSQPPLTAEAARDEGPYAVIMAPTRELAQQIADEATRFGTAVGIRAVSIVGGQSIDEQGVALREGCEIIVATPGRLLDCINRRMVVLYQCNYIVLDEADRMLDLGFEHQIQSVMEHLPSTNLRPTDETAEIAGKRYRQTIMFSATMPLKVELLAKKYLRSPVFIAIGGRAGKTADSVRQRIEWVPTETQKKARLVSVLRDFARGPAIVFCNRKATCDAIGRYISAEFPSHIHSPVVLHSGRTQDQREAGLTSFKSGRATVLVTTDVMARGIDVAGVRVVVNYELPDGAQAFERYTHRIGRTGRGGAEGTAVSFVCDNDKDIMYDLVRNLSEAKVHLPPQVRHHPASKGPPSLAYETGDGD